ncbi:6-phosphogluconolactonase [Bifidobacterium platyrrhinorum]|uniref:6-phosphogluconolactonase n=1 Tax=Bifidobacterium platyrrhinorum TaxID=2661628 RepID=A0A6L9SQV6_9BIFI|nr:6-phosphogluconolactonase [Bifidobacterium platyrrhinorum]NEG54910.1 6-phosphogluconolactonase [Bifidobacterium platyrrhinorum]
MANRTLVVYPDKSVMIQAGARRLVLALLDALDERLADGSRRTRVDVALSGGSAAQPLGLMAADPLAASIDWSRVHFWFSDERFVPADSADRNAVEARRLLLDGLVAAGSLPEANIHEMPADTRPDEEIAKVTADAESADEFVRSAADTENAALVDAAARTYETELIREMGPEPVFDLMILGMGPDGHYASLFPKSSGHSEVLVRDRLTVGVTHSPKMPPLRVSLTAPLIARSRRTWFFAAGAGKAEVLAHVFAAGGDVPAGDIVPAGDPEYPSSFAGGNDEFTWFTTEETVVKL